MPVGLPSGWESQILGDIGAPATAENIGFMDAWQRREGGSTANTCDWNPLNTTLREPQSIPCNSVGVQAFPDWVTGERATVSTLGWYPAIEAMLQTGAPDPNAPGVSDEFLKWSGGGYSWPGSGTPSTSGSGTGGGDTVPCSTLHKDEIDKILHDYLSGKISKAECTAQAQAVCPGGQCTDTGWSDAPGAGLVKGAVGAVKSLEDALKFVFSVRFVQLLAGLALLLVGVSALSKQLGGGGIPVVNKVPGG